MIKSGRLGLLIGTFFGSVIGSVSTILVFKKLGKLEEKKLIEHEQEHVEEVKKYYLEKIEEIKNNRVDATNCIEYAKKNEVKTENPEKTYAEQLRDDIEKKMKEKQRIAFENLNIEEKNKKMAGSFDYSKVSKDRYENLQKEYDREEIEIDEEAYPHLIHKSEFERPGGYVKNEIIYYEQNGLFTDMEDNVIIHLSEKYFGVDNLSNFGSEQARLDNQSGMYEMYLRDEVMHQDYHIIYNGTDDFEHMGDCRDDDD